MSKSCQPGTSALADETALPNVAAALANRKPVRILAIGAAPGRVTSKGGSYTDVIEAMLARAMQGIEVTIINRGVSGELAAGAAVRMRNEVALEEPNLVLWQVGTNDALAYVPVEEFAAVVSDQIAWLKEHKVDVVLVGLQFAHRVARSALRRDPRRAAQDRRSRQRAGSSLLRGDADRQWRGRRAAARGGRLRAQRGRLQLPRPVRGARNHARCVCQEHANAKAGRSTTAGEVIAASDQRQSCMSAIYAATRCLA
jgi:hypothetical protein